MKNLKAISRNASKQEADQITQSQYQQVLISIDWHKSYYMVRRKLDGSTPQPAQKMTPDKFLVWIAKQRLLAQKLFTCYEAGPGGFYLHRQLIEREITNYVIVPRKLDPSGKNVCTDKSDTLEMVENLDRFVRGNKKAMSVVYAPTKEEEVDRIVSRHRGYLQRKIHSLAAHICGVLLTQGLAVNHGWWKSGWIEKHKKELPAPLFKVLTMQRDTLTLMVKQLKELDGNLIEELPPYLSRVQITRDPSEAESSTVSSTKKKSAKKKPLPLPIGMGALTIAILCRELCNWKRFKNRRQIGSYTGLCGGVSQSGAYHLQLSINKHGNRRVRRLLIELAWRMVYYQPQSVSVQRWKEILLNPKAPKGARKRAIVALARQLSVDLWRWIEGAVSARQLGWEMPKGI